MSYDLYVLPAAHCADTGAAERYVATQFDQPAQAAAQSVADRITARNPDSDDGYLSVVPLDAQGEVVFVPAPFSRIQAARDVTIAEAFAAGFGVYDPQNGIVLDPRSAVAGVMTSSSNGEFGVITPEAVEHLCLAMQVEDFLIVETGEEVYCQTKRAADDSFVVERREGSVDRHFGTQVSSASAVARIIKTWLQDGPAALSGREWQAIEF